MNTTTTILESAKKTILAESESVANLVNYLTENLAKIEKLDGLLIALHGALVTDQFHDGDSELLLGL